MGFLDTFRSASTAATDALKSFTETVESHRTTIATLKQKRDALDAAFVTREELETRVAELVCARGSYWTREHGMALVHGEHSLARASVTRNHGTLREEDQLMSFGAFCAADPEAAGGLLVSLLERAGYAPGPSPAARTSEIARLTREIAELEDADERLVDEAAAAGITIAHRPEVVARRQAEARTKQLQEQQETDQRARQDRLNQSHERRSAQSTYLSRGRQAG